MKATRLDVYEAIDTERNYQNSLWPGHQDTANPLTIGEFLLMINEYADQARAQWVIEHKPEFNTLEFMRKIAGIAVNCMEQHGAPHRMATSTRSD